MTSTANPWDNALGEVGDLYRKISQASQQAADSVLSGADEKSATEIFGEVSANHAADFADRWSKCSPSKARGFMADAVTMAASIQRELDLISMDKGEVLMAGASDALNESQASDILGYKTLAGVTGSLPSQW